MSSATEPQPCQHCLDPIVSARVYESDVLGGRPIGEAVPVAQIIWVRQEDRRPWCWIPCGYEPDGHHHLPHKPMPKA